MSLELRSLRGAELTPWLDALAALRIAVFRDWPYLYDGDLDYERRYLASYAGNPRALMVGAFDGDRLVGATTAMPMADHDDAFAAALAGTGIAAPRAYYLAESLALPEYRGQGLYPRFFAQREAEGRALGFDWAVFCGVVRPKDHSARPAGHRPLDPVWRRAGYAPVPGAVARYDWRDIGAEAETPHPMQVWAKRL